MFYQNFLKDVHYKILKKMIPNLFIFICVVNFSVVTYIKLEQQKSLSCENNQGV